MNDRALLPLPKRATDSAVPWNPAPFSAFAITAALTLATLTTGCGAADMRPAPVGAAQVAQSAAPQVLTRSYFSKDATGSLTEEEMQKVLATPIDLKLPARVGVVPLAGAFDPSGKVAVATRATASSDLASALAGNRYFTHVSDVSTDLPNAGGIEGLRAIAARYRLRYLVLYSERFEDATHLNAWAFLYPTLVGMFVAPGVTVESQGLAEADLLDVRTGTILFSVVEPMHVRGKELMFGAARDHQDLQREAAREAAKALSPSA